MLQMKVHKKNIQNWNTAAWNQREHQSCQNLLELIELQARDVTVMTHPHTVEALYSRLDDEQALCN